MKISSDQILKPGVKCNCSHDIKDCPEQDCFLHKVAIISPIELEGEDLDKSLAEGCKKLMADKTIKYKVKFSPIDMKEEKKNYICLNCKDLKNLYKQKEDVWRDEVINLKWHYETIKNVLNDQIKGGEEDKEAYAKDFYRWCIEAYPNEIVASTLDKLMDQFKEHLKKKG